MPKISFNKTEIINNKKEIKIDNNLIENKIIDNKEELNDKYNPFLCNYDIFKVNKKVDKTKSYYSAFFKSIIIMTDFKAVCYNIARKYFPETDSYQYFIILYAEKVENAIDTRLDYTGGYKIYVHHLLPNINKDMNVDLKLVDESDNPKAVVYRFY